MSKGSNYLIYQTNLSSLLILLIFLELKTLGINWHIANFLREKKGDIAIKSIVLGVFKKMSKMSKAVRNGKKLRRFCRKEKERIS